MEYVAESVYKYIGGYKKIPVDIPIRTVHRVGTYIASNNVGIPTICHSEGVLINTPIVDHNAPTSVYTVDRNLPISVPTISNDVPTDSTTPNVDDDVCAICLEPMDGVCTSTGFCDCKVKYHQECLTMAIQYAGRCPICKKSNGTHIPYDPTIYDVPFNPHDFGYDQYPIELDMIHPYIDECTCMWCRIRSVLNSVIIVTVMYMAITMLITAFIRDWRSSIAMIIIVSSLACIVYVLSTL